MPAIAKLLALADQRQMYEKMRSLREVHQSVVLKLGRLNVKRPDSEKLAAGRTDLLRSLNDPLLGAYLELYGFDEAKDTIRLLLNKLSDLMAAHDGSFAQRLIDLRNAVTDELSRCSGRSDFLAKQYLHPYLSTIGAALVQTEADAKDKFVCDLHPKRKGTDIAEKRYPLHETNRTLRVSVVFVNDGPGIALDVQIEVSSNSQALAFDDHLSLGDVRPGPFLLSFEVLVVEPTQKEQFAVSVKWKEAAGSSQKEQIFDLVLVGQQVDVDWARLEGQQPYSTEVAEGEEFVGRKAKVTALTARYMKQRMVSSFITGQKRVGKTSLARAVESFISSTPSSFEYHILYLEYGSYSRMDPVETVQALGLELAEFMGLRLPSMPAIDGLDFRGSLAPLSRIADSLLQLRPKLRFLLVLDEFDEIHSAMYRFGSLAEAFFANIRALSGKKNVAFLLVGGEKMPFIMSAQGDQLNRFVREPLDYFSRVVEWDDYVELVRRPVRGSLNWDDTAIERLFELTNGHPYYTKLLCSKVYSTAVLERDTELTPREVADAARNVVRELDSNAFAHVWKDGIQQEGAEAEVVELRRRRVLCAASRALRDRADITADSVAKHKSGLRLENAEILPQLNDLVRRGFASHRHGTYVLTIPLFRDWLIEYGVSQIMSDTLAEEYETAVQRAEEQAYVTPAEITGLVRRWHIYKGQPISVDVVRAWLDQISSQQEQRLLFKLLQHIRFFSTSEVREKLRQAHNMLTQYLRPFVQQKRVDRRNDVVVTYVDGLGKSGARFADYYAEENRINIKCVMPPGDLAQRIEEHEERSGHSVSAIVLVDDFVGSGRSLSGNIAKFVDQNRKFMTERHIRLFVVVMACTREGDEAMRNMLGKIGGIDAEFRVCEFMQSHQAAFDLGNEIWKDAREMEVAKTLCTRIGSLVHRENPLGFANQGLLVVFPENCPNNSLPLLHSAESKEGGWWPLFPRSKN